GSSISMRDAVISQNVGFGVQATTRSTIQILSSTITNNVVAVPGSGDGIRVILGSALFASAPVTSVTGNAGFGLICTDAESSLVGAQNLAASGNASGGISCTGF